MSLVVTGGCDQQGVAEPATFDHPRPVASAPIQGICRTSALTIYGRNVPCYCDADAPPRVS